MIKQTVEEAVRLLYPIYPHTTAMDCDTLNIYRKIWKEGAAWQKEQNPYSLEQVKRIIDMARSPSWSKEELINYLNTGILPD